ncbi:hypothetical protein GE061_007360 [Apolygus lucorum]|uniref:GB1/RHD3-type G domain-containing protein n=1 Tax=Apolygus lucorum TaxID=248454 RepID=A0A8S9WSZ3_APOLU|nr:hypothetical protein GE061_007360 [Apolygus lucorum]
MVIKKAVCVVNSKGKSRYALDEKNLRSVLDVDDVRDRKIVVISLVGASRTGKSVLANFFLRYLESRYCTENASMGDEKDWMKGDENQPLLGFPWSVSAGTKPVTKGIWMSSKAYLTDRKNEKIAIVVLDSQGIYDSFTTNKDWTTILAFTGLISSVTCYNVFNDIKLPELNSLLFFCQYGRVAVQSSSGKSKPMQNMMFVIRDWQNSRKYGEQEGALYLAHKLHPRGDFKEQLNSYFDKISCFVLPFPGIRVEALDYHGSINQLSEPFKNNLHDLVKLLFDPEKLVLKEINHDVVTAEQLIDYFKTYIGMLQGEDLPEPKSMFQMTVEAHNRAAITAAKTVYINSMKRLSDALNEEQLNQKHLTAMNMALQDFDQKPKLGTKAMSETYRAQLEEDLNVMYRRMRLALRRKKDDAWRPYILGSATLAMAIALEMVLSRWKWHRLLDLVFNLSCKWALLGLLTWSYFSFRNMRG